MDRRSESEENLSHGEADLNDTDLDDSDVEGNGETHRPEIGNMNPVGAHEPLEGRELEAEIISRYHKHEYDKRKQIELELKAHNELLHRQQLLESMLPPGLPSNHPAVSAAMSAVAAAATLASTHGPLGYVNRGSPPPPLNFSSVGDIHPNGGSGVPIINTNNNNSSGNSIKSDSSSNNSQQHSPSHHIINNGRSSNHSSIGNGVSPPTLSPSIGPSDNPQNYSFEEQFKQLYELDNDTKRKEFLDDLFAFMQKRGTPVNRIPIMAKSVLDLYGLYRLVVARGGLVEVINKKIWREITKGLNLPSSITSAAFTLRTQYMKYLYPYECTKQKLSSPEELQAAIDGNRREGRRSSYGEFGNMLPQISGNRSLHDSSPLSLVSRQHFQMNGNGNHALSSGDDDSPPSTPTSMLPQREALNLEVNRSLENSAKAFEHASKRYLEDGGPPSKRHLMDDERLLAHAALPSAHIKITSRGDGRSQIDNSLVVSMEVNGIMYQGVLFAQPPRS